MLEAKLNREWHKTHPMPTYATEPERLAWHLEHAKHCACEPMPVAAFEELQRRGLNLDHFWEEPADSDSHAACG